MESNVKQRKKDKRIERTKIAIQNAFIVLLAEKGYNDITVKDIADKADVDRRTIYNYYKGIHEIRAEIDKSIIFLINSTFTKLDVKNHLNNPEWIADTLGEEIEKNFDFLDKLFKIAMDSELLTKMTELFSEMFSNLLEENGLVTKEKKKAVGDFASVGLLYSFQSWFRSNRLVSVRAQSKYVINMIASVIKSMEDYEI